MTKPAFKKGQKVTVYSRWSEYVVASYRHATVHSCGLKVAKLIDDETGDMFGTNLRPVDCTGTSDLGIHQRAATEEETLRIAMKVAEKMHAGEVDHFDRCLKGYADDESYCRVMQARKEDHLSKSPDIIDFHEGSRKIREAIRA